MRNVLLAVGVIVVGIILYFWRTIMQRIRRLLFVSRLFSGTEQHEVFNRLHETLPCSRMQPSETPLQFLQGEKIELPETFEFEGKTQDLNQFLNETDTSALLVLKDGQLVYESYWLTGGPDVQWISMSVAKSFISALIGIAVEEGHIQSIEEPITKYTPSLLGSAYDNVRIKDVLQMSSGASWNEDYSDSKSDVMRFARAFATGASINQFVATVEREFEPGTFNRYNSADTQALGLLLASATGRSIIDYMEEKLWQPMGAAAAGHWLLDNTGMELAFGGMTATARDYAKIGELYRLGGKLNGKQIVPADWVSASIVPDAPHLLPGADPEFELGYGYQWWLPESEEGEFTAIGVYNQFVYINPTHDVVIVKLSAFRQYGLTLDESSYREIETVECFRAIVQEIVNG